MYVIDDMHYSQFISSLILIGFKEYAKLPLYESYKYTHKQKYVHVSFKGDCNHAPNHITVQNNYSQNKSVKYKSKAYSSYTAALHKIIEVT